MQQLQQQAQQEAMTMQQQQQAEMLAMQQQAQQEAMAKQQQQQQEAEMLAMQQQQAEMLAMQQQEEEAKWLAEKEAEVARVTAPTSEAVLQAQAGLVAVVITDDSQDTSAAGNTPEKTKEITENEVGDLVELSMACQAVSGKCINVYLWCTVMLSPA